ncbi:myosin-2-like [Salvia hispanica]|uniref:myosin-2-like n=1 Tax=Salvia hispanica TaxID=49212 RepID=UPI0020092E04|nr:myosin-2-like [Salvia hispanica]
MLAVAPNCITRSSLEKMLEALQRRDESGTPDVPPALPRRAIPPSRTPSAKRRLSVSMSDTAGVRSGFCVKNGKMRGIGFRDAKVELRRWCYADDKRIDKSAPHKVGFLKGFRQQILTPEVQKYLDTHQHLHELNEIAVTLQSYVRGEIARKEYSALLAMKNQVKLDEMVIVQLQSVIRGWLARRHFCRLQKWIEKTRGKVESDLSISEVEKLSPKMLPLIVGELQKRVLMAEETLEQKEKENATFREQLQQYEARLAKMKSMMWQQMDLATAEKSVVREGQRDGGQPPCPYRETSECLKHGINELVKTKVSFEDGNHATVGTPVGKLQKLKRVIKAWVKGKKVVSMRDSKTKIHSMGHGEADGHPKKWWGKKRKRSWNHGQDRYRLIHIS